MWSWHQKKRFLGAAFSPWHLWPWYLSSRRSPAASHCPLRSWTSASSSQSRAPRWEGKPNSDILQNTQCLLGINVGRQRGYENMHECCIELKPATWSYVFAHFRYSWAHLIWIHLVQKEPRVCHFCCQILFWLPLKMSSLHLDCFLQLLKWFSVCTQHSFELGVLPFVRTTFVRKGWVWLGQGLLHLPFGVWLGKKKLTPRVAERNSHVWSRAPTVC